MNQLEYLYGVSEAHWNHLPEKEALEIQNHLGEELLDELYVEYYEKRDIKRINAIIRTLKRNIALLRKF